MSEQNGHSVGAFQQDTYTQTELADNLETFKFNEEYEYVLDVHHDNGIKFSALVDHLMHQGMMTMEEFTSFLRHLDLDRGQYIIAVKNGKVEFRRVRRNWIQKRDIKR